MRITKVDTFVLEKPLARAMRISRGGFTVRRHAIVRVHTDAGITGLGEGIGEASLVRAALDGGLARRIVGTDPFATEDIRLRMTAGQVYFERGGAAFAAASAVEMACLDIKGKALEVPVYELLGGKVRDRVQAYASDVYWQESRQAMAEDAARIAALGFRGIKAHVGVASASSEAERIRAIRQAVGSNIAIMIDLNCGYSPLEARLAMRRWEEFDLTWIEEPCAPEHDSTLRDLRALGTTPIAAGENEFGLARFAALFSARALDVAMPDAGRVGGLLETCRVAALAQASGVTFSPHNFSSGILLAATLHVMASVPAAEWLEMDTSGNAVYDDCLEQPLSLSDGEVRVPEGPGLGVRLPDPVLERYATMA